MYEVETPHGSFPRQAEGSHPDEHTARGDEPYQEILPSHLEEGRPRVGCQRALQPEGSRTRLRLRSPGRICPGQGPVHVRGGAALHAGRG